MKNNIISRQHRLSVAKKGINEIHVAGNEIALCRMIGNICWTMTKYYPIESAPVFITKHIG